MRAEDEYPLGAHGIKIRNIPLNTWATMCSEIDRLRGHYHGSQDLLAHRSKSIETLMGVIDDRDDTIEQMKQALAEQQAKNRTVQRKLRRVTARCERERQEADKRCSERILKVGVKLGRKEAHDELVDRKGEPLPTAREIMDRAAGSIRERLLTHEQDAELARDLQRIADTRKVNFDGSRVTRYSEDPPLVGVGDVAHVCPAYGHANCYEYEHN